ncbi:MAG: hypothetical protein ABJH04_03310 [Cyclobacteriaceae bacterium]
MKVFLLISLIGCFGVSQAEVTFHDGVVVLRTGEIVSGKISVASFQLALVEKDEVRQVFPAHLVDKIRFYDEEHNINRKFVSIQSKITKEFSLYEKIVNGAAIVLRKPKFLALQSSQVSVLDHTQFEYFVMYEGGIVPINQVKRTFFNSWNRMVAYELSSYVKDEHLNLYATADVILLIKYYNQSVRRKLLLADL